MTSPRHLAAQRGVHCLNTTHYNTVKVTTRRAVATDVTTSPRGSARCPLIVTNRRAVSTDITPSPRGSARCPLLVHYTLHHVRGHD
ncbi:hypothetical protein J6590_085226 [Homalodisca vitripennis]|nr:hypothetical protein J6590_085226 [Homalodisca vitripennis]